MSSALAIFTAVLMACFLSAMEMNFLLALYSGLFPFLPGFSWGLRCADYHW
jgi:hypothetical protein